MSFKYGSWCHGRQQLQQCCRQGRGHYTAGEACYADFLHHFHISTNAPSQGHATAVLFSRCLWPVCKATHRADQQERLALTQWNGNCSSRTMAGQPFWFKECWLNTRPYADTVWSSFRETVVWIDVYSTRTGSDVTVVNTTGEKKAFISVCALVGERTGQGMTGGTILFVVWGAMRSSISLSLTKIQVQ